ncbi:MAG TPA: VWA domain-containing protein [Nitrososphaerales archaeon]
MKGECEGCSERARRESERLSNVLGQDFIDDLIYGLFNPEGIESQEEDASNFEQMIEDLMSKSSNDMKEESLQEWLGELEGNWFYRSWIRDYAKRERAREAAWQSIIEKIERGQIDPKDLPMKQLLKNFPRRVMEHLSQEGYIDLKWEKHLMHPKVYLGHAEFTAQSERLIAKRLLEEAFANLEKMGFGEHETLKIGAGVSSSNIVAEFDELQHSFDNLDLQETLVGVSFRDPEQMQMQDEDFKARIPNHRSSSSNIILMDISGSMYGDKYKGCVMAGLALGQLLEEEYKEDKLRIVAYNDEPMLVLEGQILRLRPHGQTDIGRALDFCIQMLSKEEGNRNIFLLTDSEPTVSYNRDQSPIENMYRAAYLAGKENIRMNIVMLDRNPALKAICENMAKLNGCTKIVYVDNPLNLKEFIIKTYIDSRRWF